MQNWYILQVHSGTEQKVKKELMAQLEKKGLKDNIEKIEIPSEEVVEMKKGKKINAERKFFPGYMLIKMIMDDDIWHTVRSIPKVYGFLGGKKGEPIPVSQNEIDSILVFLKNKLNNHKIKFIINIIKKNNSSFIYTPEEKFKKMKSINPAIQILKKTFDLNL